MRRFLIGATILGVLCVGQGTEPRGAAAVTRALLPSSFQIVLPWTSGAYRISSGYLNHGVNGASCSGYHSNVDKAGVTNDAYAIDFALPYRTPVVAVATGRVMWAGLCDGKRGPGYCNGSSTWPKYGNSVSIAHYGTGTGFTSFYAHLDSIAVRSGDVVIGGKTVLGYVGQTGTEGGVHLHFAMYHNDPASPLSTPKNMPPYGGVATAPEPFADCVKSNGAPCTTLRAGDTLSRATAPFGPITVSVLSFRDDASTFLNTSHALEITYTYDLGGRSPNGYMLWSETVPNCGEYNPDGLSDGRGTTTTILSCPGVGGLTTTAVRLSIKAPDGSTVYSHDFPYVRTW